MSINNRQQNNGRRRGRSNNGPRQSGGSQSRNYDQGNRIDSRARGNATQLLEKYRNMARDAQLSGDRVMTEYYLQFADHYFRVLSDARVRQEEQRGRGDDHGDSGQSDNEGDDLAEELDAIDMIGRAPRNIQDRGRGERSDNRDRGDGRGEERSERQPRDVRGDTRNEGRGAPRERYGNQDTTGNRERGGNGRDTLRNEGRNDGRNGGHDDDASFGIDVAVLPPAIGIEPAREVSATPSDGGEAEAAPKRRGRPRKLAAEGETAQS
ncbi:MAG: DUF4167 domain-containing protein [Pseudomonadota bacterium]